MKLKLTESRGIQTLLVSGEVDDAAFAVLRAGITKIMRSGKNRIAMDLSSVPSITAAMAMETAKLNVLAKELAGEIVVAGANPKVRELFESVQVKPLINHRATLAEAIEGFFRPLSPKPVPVAAPAPVVAPKPAAMETPTPAPAPSATQISASKEVAELREELKLLKAKLLEKEGGGDASLKKDLAESQKHVSLLKRQVEEMVFGRRVPFDEAGHLDRTRVLEGQLEEAYEKITTLEAKAVK